VVVPRHDKSCRRVSDLRCAIEDALRCLPPHSHDLASRSVLEGKFFFELQEAPSPLKTLLWFGTKVEEYEIPLRSFFIIVDDFFIYI
jgi:hypothetical protein